jgi:hypothetical protein
LTSYPEVNTVLFDLLARVKAILGDRFVGLYLYGSLASGGFYYHQRDIDFIGFTIERSKQFNRRNSNGKEFKTIPFYRE